jgi:3-methyladenine DNA glycosylase AlkD
MDVHRAIADVAPSTIGPRGAEQPGQWSTASLSAARKASYKKVMLVHGAKEPIHGVAISELKKTQKRAGGTNHALALELWDSGVYDAMYLAGLLADEAQMKPADLQRWLKSAKSPALAEYTVPWVAGGGPHGWKLGKKWIDSKDERTAAAGWNTLAGVVAITPDEQLDLPALAKLLARVEERVHTAPNRVRYTMNSFVIALGSFVKSMTADALATGKRIGVVEVDMGGTSCKVPSAPEYIGKVKAKGAIGKKRKSLKC